MFGFLSRLIPPSPEGLSAAAVRLGLADGSIRLVDVREPHEFAADHVAGAVNLPLSRFDPAQLPPAQPGQRIVLMCRSGARSARALGLARRAGRSDVVNFPGSIRELQGPGRS